MDARILIIDDEPQMRRMLRESLTRAGYWVDEACDGLHALALFSERRPHLVITDIVMPQREGLETIQELRKRVPMLPIIAISGGGRQNPYSYLAIAETLGANRTFTKPFRLEDLLSAVEQLIPTSLHS